MAGRRRARDVRQRLHGDRNVQIGTVGQNASIAISIAEAPAAPSSPVAGFDAAALSPGQHHGDAGDTFRRLTRDLFQEAFPGLTLGPANGCGIDLVEEGPASRVVFECLCVDRPTLSAVKQAWTRTRANLARHLARRDRAEYAPWWDPACPVTRYRLCVSVALTEHLREQVRKQVETFIRGLAREHGHLGALKHVAVDVLDWSDCRSRLDEHPGLRYRWYDAQRVTGLVPIDQPANDRSFRAYLEESRLPYYPLSRDADGMGEGEMLAMLDTSPGLIVTGPGGVGKTRLCLELGRLAAGEWVVLRAVERLTPEMVRQLQEQLDPALRAMVVVDYLEDQRSFADAIAELLEINETHHLSIRFVGNCRSSYYESIAPHVPHQRVVIPDLAADPGRHEEHRRRTIEHILRSGGVEVTDLHVAMCHGLPVLAVFLCYLVARGRRADLEELVHEQSFGAWIRRRVLMSLGHPIDEELVRVAALCPLPANLPPALRGPGYHDVVERLQTDGWLEERDAPGVGPQLAMVHDVLADQIVSAYLETHAAAASRFVAELLEFAEGAGLRSALMTLQRLREHPALGRVPWLRIFHERIGAAPAAWSEVRDLLWWTPLLEAGDRLDLLDRRPEFWRGLEHDPWFQGGLGWLARRIAGGELTPTDDQQRTIRDWVRQICPLVGGSNYLLTSATLLLGDEVRESCLEWLGAHGLEFQAHYLVVAWLQAGLAPGDIREQLLRWCRRFARLPHAGFVIGRWLEFGDDPESVEPFVVPWLEANGGAPGAPQVIGRWLTSGADPTLVKPFVVPWMVANSTALNATQVLGRWLHTGDDPRLVEPFMVPWLQANGAEYPAHHVIGRWLESGGDPALVAPFMVPWLEANGTTPIAAQLIGRWLESGGDPTPVSPFVPSWLEVNPATDGIDFLIRRWLMRGGDFSVVGDAALRWLHENRDREEAVYLIKSLTDVPLPADSIRDILVWCTAHSGNVDAIWRLSQLGTRLQVESVAEEAMAAAEAVMEALARSYSHDNRRSVTYLFISLLRAPRLHELPFRSALDRLFVRWIAGMDDFEGGWAPDQPAQADVITDRLEELVDGGDAGAAAAAPAVRRWLRRSYA